MAETLLRVENLCQYYKVERGLFGKPAVVKAVDGVSFDIREGEVFGIVGESGCGKSTLGKAISKLIEPTSGNIIFQGKDITRYTQKQMRDVRKNIQMVFQDPYASLNPRMSIRSLLAEPLEIHGINKSKEETDKIVVDLLRLVGMDDYHAVRYPHEFSGGQRQRIGIARAIAIRPKLIIADEPVSALDVSIQSQVLNLMNKLKKELNLTYLFIAHDLSVVEHISDRVGVMYLGNFVEVAEKNELYRNPLHPYTKALLSAVPIPDPTVKKERIILQGTIPSPLNAPKGCKFCTRCPNCMDICRETPPAKTMVGEDHYVYCHLFENTSANA